MSAKEYFKSWYRAFRLYRYNPPHSYALQGLENEAPAFWRLMITPPVANATISWKLRVYSREIKYGRH